MTSFIGRMGAIFSGVLVTAAVASAEPLTVGTYKLTPQNTQVEFAIDNFWGVVTSHGKFTALQGELVFAEPLQQSTIKVTIETTSIDTNIGKRDEHLRGDDFLAVGTFPTMSFQSTKVSGTQDAFEVEGLLTLKGNSKPVTLKGSLNKERSEITAVTTINRQNFGVAYSGKGLADDLLIELKFQPQAAVNK